MAQFGFAAQPHPFPKTPVLLLEGHITSVVAHEVTAIVASLNTEQPGGKGIPKTSG
jgi:hypothetical protein